MTRYEAIIKERRARQYAKLERAANDIRDASRKHQVQVKFFGTFARNRVDKGSDLDILVYGTHVPDAFQSELDRIGVLHDVDLDIRKERDAPHLAMDAIT